MSAAEAAEAPEKGRTREMKVIKRILGTIPVLLVVAVLGGAVYLGCIPRQARSSGHWRRRS